MTAQKPVTHDDVKKLLGDAIQDDDFADKLFGDPKKTLEGLGYEATDQVVDFFHTLAKGNFPRVARATTVKGPDDGIEFAGDA